MRSYRFCYTLQSSFVPSVNWHFFKLRVVPCHNEFQHCVLQKFQVTPVCHLITTTDGFGNSVQYGSISYDHSSFTVMAEGIVEQFAPYEIIEEPSAFYRASTRLTLCNESMRRMAQRLATPEVIMRYVHELVRYMPCSTTVATTAQDVYRERHGVCQDFAHLMIAMCRAAGLYARYVNGIIIGEGQTHAWVEVSDGKVWRAYDPTHNSQIEWDYVKIAHGRDADDCATNRGRIYSWTNETMMVSCKLTKQ